MEVQRFIESLFQRLSFCRKTSHQNLESFEKKSFEILTFARNFLLFFDTKKQKF